MRRKKPLQVANVQADTRYQNVELARREGLVSLLSVPLIFSGQAIGALSVYTARPYSFSNEEIKILGALAELSAIAIEKARLYERIVDVEEQLRQNEKLSALGLLAAEVAHEIRNPLTVMKLLYHSLNLKFEAKDPRAKDAQIIEAKIEHLNKIVEQILDFARTTEPKFAPVNLNDLVDELSLLVRHKLANQGHQAGARFAIRSAAGARRRAATGAGVFESDFERGGGDARRRHAHDQNRWRSRPAQVAVAFKDTGGGMTKEQQQRAFKTVLATTKAKGTGIGLAIVGRIIETHHGQIRILSRPGRGTTLRITLPVK